MSRTSKSARACALKPKLLAASVAACFSLAATGSLANPTGPSVISGAASFTSAGSMLTVANSANAIINWQGFSIGVNEITRFLQSSAASAVLNRVIGAGGVIPQSVIDGVLSSNGRVFLLNPSGVLFGAGSRVDVAGLVVSSLNLSNEDFLSGRMRFTEVPGAGSVVNNGAINAASGGKVFLVAPDVSNTGLITSPQGQIVLAAGKSVELVSENSPYVTVRVSADSEQALNLGSLVADSGRIDMAGALVRNAGVVAANGAVVGAGGEVRLVATKDLTLDAGSVTSANGASGGSVLLQVQGGTNLIAGKVETTGISGQGGQVQALGVRVGVIGNGVIDASGDTGGGTVLVGGDAHGANPQVQNAERTLIGADGVIRTDAKTTGNGGRVIVWADGDTRFYGSVSARGGAQSGDGGFVETSGKQGLSAFGQVDTRAPNGQGGTWLLDPNNITIINGAYGSATEDGYVCCGTFAYGSGPTASTVSNGAIAYGMMSNGSVEIQATNNINFSANVDTSAYAGGFTARANNDIDLHWNNITTHGNVVLSANDSTFGTALGGSIKNTDPGIGSRNGLGNITTNGGSVTLTGYGVAVGAITTSGPLAGGSMNGSVGVTTTGGNISTGSIITKSLTTSNGNGGSVTLQTASGAITVSGDIDTSGANGNSSNTWGTSGGNVNLFRTDTNPSTPGAIRVTGSIRAYGGDASAGSGNNGGSGGTVFIARDPYSNPVYGSVGVGIINMHGGNGASGSTGSAGGAGGVGGSVLIRASGAVTTSAIDAHGGQGGNGGVGVEGHDSGGLGGPGGFVDIIGASISTMGDGIGTITTRGGDGGNGGAATYANGNGAGGNAGFGGFVKFNAAGASGGAAYGAVRTGDIDARGGNGGNAGAGTGSNGYYGGDGGWGGYVQIYNASSITTGAITTLGGSGGHGGGAGHWYNYNPYILPFICCSGHQGAGNNAGFGGKGGFVSLNSSGAVNTGAIDVSGGKGGSSGLAPDGKTYSAGYGGDGGEGGFWNYVNISGASVSTMAGGTGTINARGGDGGAGSGSFAGGHGGLGSRVTVQASGSAPSGFVNTGPIYTTGGSGGASISGSPGSAGTDRTWTVSGNTVTMGGIDLAFMSQGTVTANTAFEIDPTGGGTIAVSSGNFFSHFTQQPTTVKIGNGSTVANLALTGQIDLSSTQGATLDVTTSGTVTQQDSGPGAGDATLKVTNLYAQGASVSLVGGPGRKGNSVAKLQGAATGGSFEFLNNGALNLALVDSAHPAGGVSAATSVALQASGGITSSLGQAVQAGTGITLNSSAGPLGSASVPLQLRVSGSLGGSAYGGIYLNNTGPLTLNNLTEMSQFGDLVVNNVGALTVNAGATLSTNAGNLTLTAHSPLYVLGAIRSGGSIFLSTGGGSPPNNMWLQGPFTYGSTGVFEVTIGVNGELVLMNTNQRLFAPLFPNPLGITKFTFLSGDLLGTVFIRQAEEGTIQSIINSASFSWGSKEEEEDDKKVIGSCRG